MRNFILSNDKYKMNWIEGNEEWGTVKCPDGIVCKKTSEKDGDVIREKYEFTNESQKDIFTSLTDISIYTPFNDSYPDSEICIKNRCHAHIWCGENVSYIMALRMGGESPHAGLVLTKGSISAYSVERDFKEMSNDRGDFLLHPTCTALAPGESFSIEWVLFGHNGRNDFFEKAKKYNKHFIDIKADKYVLFDNENVNIKIAPSFSFKDIKIKRNNVVIDFLTNGSEIQINEKHLDCGEYTYTIDIDGVITHCTLCVLPKIETLIKNRCDFIAKRQQCINTNSRLYGAYLVYDNEEKHTYYNKIYDYNGGRERVCMGIVIAQYLQKMHSDYLKDSLELYMEYVKRELVDIQTGEVFNDYMRDRSYTRLYNSPWFCLFFIELYKLYSSREYLEIAYRILKRFYDDGGDHFYAIEIPADLIIECMRAEKMDLEAEDLIACFKKHCEFIMERGLSYPAHEVHFEQSIVAPAADMLLKTYCITKDTKYLLGAETHIAALDLFNGQQPDFHMYETAIRHWDGYWFGKGKLYGDTFPHYWSAYTGMIFKRYGEITGKKEYIKRSEYSVRGVMSLFKTDGRASCAFVYPQTVNGIKAHYADKNANDQDWGMYFMMCKKE